MMRTVKRLLILLIAFAPLNGLRVFLYRLLLGYKIGARAKFGLGVIIAVESFRCGDDVMIRRGTVFQGPMRVDLGAKTFIGRYNKFECGESAGDAASASMGYARAISTGRDCLINESHLFDVLGRIDIGAGTWIAGFASQFLTHGASAMDRDITIGESCFLGSAVRFAPGATIGNRVIVGMGSVVTKPLLVDDAVIAGVPAKLVRTREADDQYAFEKSWL